MLDLAILGQKHFNAALVAASPLLCAAKKDEILRSVTLHSG